jgi:hypothetical protein
MTMPDPIRAASSHRPGEDFFSFIDLFMEGVVAMTPVREQVKAITGGVLAGLIALGTALVDSGVTPLEWVLVAVAAVGTYGGVYGIPQPAPLPTLTSAELRGMADRVARQEREAPR